MSNKKIIEKDKPNYAMISLKVVIFFLCCLFLFGLRNSIANFTDDCKKDQGTVFWKKKYQPVCLINGTVRNDYESKYK